MLLNRLSIFLSAWDLSARADFGVNDDVNVLGTNAVMSVTSGSKLMLSFHENQDTIRTIQSTKTIGRFRSKTCMVHFLNNQSSTSFCVDFVHIANFRKNTFFLVPNHPHTLLRIVAPLQESSWFRYKVILGLVCWPYSGQKYLEISFLFGRQGHFSLLPIHYAPKLMQKFILILFSRKKGMPVKGSVSLISKHSAELCMISRTVVVRILVCGSLSVSVFSRRFSREKSRL